MNLLPAVAGPDGARIGSYSVPIDRAAAAAGARRDHDRRPPRGVEGRSRGRGRAAGDRQRDRGARRRRLHVRHWTDVDGTVRDVVVRLDARRAVEKGATVHVTANPEKVHVFETATGARLSE